MSEPKLQGKSQDIPKQLVWDAWLKVKRNGGAAGAAAGRPSTRTAGSWLRRRFATTG